MGQFTSQAANPMLMQMLQSIFAQGAPNQNLGMGGIQRPQAQAPQQPLANLPPASFAPSTMYGDGQFRPGEFNMQTMVDVQNAMAMGMPTAQMGMQPMNPAALINPVAPQPAAPTVASRPMQAIPSFVNQPPLQDKLLGGAAGMDPFKMKLPKFGEL